MSKFNNYKNYNPDILETIANLSNDEVFTPPKLANQILDLLPEEVWSNPNLTFLDPAVKTGVFLREIASRLIDGLADQIPDLQERVNHILTKQVFGIGITELTTLMARRTVYCSMYANGEFSICTEFDDEKGNIVFPDTEHTWDKNGRCEFCGANIDNYGGGGNKENYAYPFIHDNFEKEFGNMKFDVIIGNPPYQLNDGGGAGDSSVPLYDKFIEKSLELNPKFMCMIIPSRWMVGGKGLNKFRAEMINNGKFKIIHDYENSQELFPNVGVNGGINYFLWDKDHKGEVEYFFHKKNGEVKRSNRKLKNKISEYVIRNNEDATLIENIFKKSKNFFSDIVSSGDPYGFRTDAFNKKDIGLSNEKSDFNCIMFGVKKTKRTHMYVDKKYITKNKDNIDKFKLFFPSVFGTETTLLPEIIIGEKDSICTGSFIEIGPFNDKIELENCLKYMRTKFFRYLFHVNKYSYGMSKRTFSLIPLQDFSKSWTDEELYKKYKLTQEEIDYIEENIDPMPSSDD